MYVSKKTCEWRNGLFDYNKICMFIYNVHIINTLKQDASNGSAAIGSTIWLLKTLEVNEIADKGKMEWWGQVYR